MGELRTAAGDLRVPPVAFSAHQGVVENVGPVLKLEVRAVGRGAARLVDPDAGRPAGAGPHQRGMQGAVGLDGEARDATVEQRDGASIERFHARRGLLVDDDLGVGEVVGHRRDRGAQAFLVRPVDHQHRQRPHSTQVGAGQPHLRQPGRRRHPQPGPAGLGQLPVEFFGVDRIGPRQHGFGEGVAGWPAQRDPRIRQVGVDVEVAVAGLVGTAAGGRDAGADQRDHQVARQRARHRLVGRHHLGHRHRPHRIVNTDPGRRGQARTSCRPGCPASAGARRCPPIRGPQKPCAATQNRAPRRRRPPH